MYWPRITNDIKDSILACKVCLAFSDKQQREPYNSDTVTRLWSHLSLDNFEFQGQHFLMILDVATKFFIVRMVSSLNMNCTIRTLSSVFSEQGLPIAIKCDRGRNLVSDLFQQYCQHLGINLTFASTYQHSGNPAERAMKCCTMAKQSWRLALLEYLATPLDSNTPSPSGLNSHTFNSLLPSISNSKFSDVLVERHDAQLQHDTRGRTLPELPVGSKVGYKDHFTNRFNVGIVSVRDARSYEICTEHGTHISRNRIDLKWTDAPFELKPMSNFAKYKHAPTTVPSNANFKHDNKAMLIGKRVNVRKCNSTNSMYTTHSGRFSKPATRLLTQM